MAPGLVSVAGVARGLGYGLAGSGGQEREEELESG
jgi:hypothetical protein